MKFSWVAVVTLLACRETTHERMGRKVREDSAAVANAPAPPASHYRAGAWIHARTYLFTGGPGSVEGVLSVRRLINGHTIGAKIGHRNTPEECANLAQELAGQLGVPSWRDRAMVYFDRDSMDISSFNGCAFEPKPPRRN